MQHVYRFARPFIFKIPPETAHKLTIRAMKVGVVRRCRTPSYDPSLRQELFGLTFHSPVGLAAGFDKNAEVIVPILKLGFAFTEVGTVTPQPQAGNPLPRIIRDPDSLSVINRMGFPNAGLDRFKGNLMRARNDPSRPDDGIIGVNIGMNKDQKDPVQDYTALIEALAPLADYVTVNISSPNTPGLRDLQDKAVLSEFLPRLVRTLKYVCQDFPPALLLKLSPDLTEKQEEEIAQTVLEHQIDGLILTNTTLDRPETLSEPYRSEKGGLSGAPVRQKSTDTIRRFYRLTKGKIPIVGVGGVFTAQDAYEKIKAGAHLVQLYTGMVYEGPDIAHTINTALPDLLKEDGFAHIGEAVGVESGA